MPRYIDAEIMPHGPLWEQLTDNEKINVLSYLLSSPSVDVVKEIFYYICGNVVHFPGTLEDMLVMSRQEFEKVLKKYNIEGIEF
jgi:hypothetical protein